MVWKTSNYNIQKLASAEGFPGGSYSKESACNAGDLIQSLCQGDPLEKEMATHSSIPAWEIPWTEEPEGLQSTGSQSQTQLSDSIHMVHAPPFVL